MWSRTEHIYFHICSSFYISHIESPSVYKFSFLFLNTLTNHYSSLKLSDIQLLKQDMEKCWHDEKLNEKTWQVLAFELKSGCFLCFAQYLLEINQPFFLNNGSNYVCLYYLQFDSGDFCINTNLMVLHLKQNN